jgi:hypothetical protein
VGLTRKRRRSSPWWVGRRWSVESLSDAGQWQEIYTAQTKAQAGSDAAEWHEKTGRLVRVVPGDGHPSRRNQKPDPVVSILVAPESILA